MISIIVANMLRIHVDTEIQTPVMEFGKQPLAPLKTTVVLTPNTVVVLDAGQGFGFPR